MHGFRPRWLLLAVATVLPSGFVSAAEPAPLVPGFERFYSDAKTDTAKGGQLLLGELNCTSCHLGGDAALPKKQAPILDGVAGRARLGHIRKFLDNPQAVKPGTTMPHLFAGDTDKAAKVDALVHFLASTGTVRHTPPDAKAIPLGRDLYSKVGCVACHGPRDALGDPQKVEGILVPLGELKTKYSVASLSAFLENPLAVRPSGRMPHLVNGKDAKDVATYLLQGVKADFTIVKGGTTYAYYEGTWDKVPDFDKLKAKASGTGAAFDLGVARRGNDYGIKFEGFFKVDQEGEYSFSVHSDDGSRLYVDGKQVVDNDGVHPPKAVSGKTKLTKGVHKATVGFFQVGGGAELEVKLNGPGVGDVNLAEIIAASEAALEKVTPKPKQDDEDFVEFKPELVEKGKALFTSVGCANCHTLRANNKPLASTLEAPPLNKLKAEGGCLAASPAKGLPAFGLSTAQRNAMIAAIKTPPAVSKEPAEVIARTMTTFNCYACHMRSQVGGVDLEGDLNKFFVTLQPEMGDEGRLPPMLDHVGAKLVPDYLKGILDRGAHDRPYMLTRMPGFGIANVGQLVEAFAAVDKLPAIPPIDLHETPTKVKSAARFIVGGTAMGCIKCHTFNGQKAEGVQGIDMTLMPKRLQRDWFHAYLTAPAKLKPGTRMPDSWPNGKSFYKDLLEGKPANQMEAIWVYLQDGGKAQLPIGVGKRSIPLVPEKNAIIYRNFIEGAGTRGIAVGYPEKAHLAFDANEMRLVMIWQGAFFDAGPNWTDRGVGYVPPLGDNILHLPAGVPFAVLEKPADAWPKTPAKEQGYRFKGYTLTPDDRPTFQYSFGDVKVEDFPNAVAGKDPSIKRVLKLSADKAVDHLYFRAAAGKKIEPAGDGWYHIDGWKMKIDGATPQIRKSGDNVELLVPVSFKDGKAQLTQEFVWG
jgi:mono/diheme cytochrome c family protein